jgi:hypothetical protein
LVSRESSMLTPLLLFKVTVTADFYFSATTLQPTTWPGYLVMA